MADFNSGFWNWFIIVPTIVGMIALLLLTLRMSGSTGAPGQPVKTMGHVWDEDLAEYNNPLPRWWLNLFYITLVFSAIYLVLYPGLGSWPGTKHWSQVKQYDDEMAAAKATYGPIFDKYLHEDLTAVAADPAALKIGARLFATYCTQCHGSDARGARGYPNLTDNDWLYGGTPDKIEETILGGRQGTMPAWGDMGMLDKEQIFSVSEYVLSLSGRQTDPVVAEKGKAIFAANCAACHGADGKGNQQLGAPNLTDDIWLFGGSQARVIETITHGRAGKMPAHKEFLGEAKVHLLAAYVYSLSHGGEKQ